MMIRQFKASQPYDTVADAYDRLGEVVIASWGEKPHNDKADFLARLWADGTSRIENVLELACGTGLMLQQLVRNGHQVVGLDRSAAMLSRARVRLGPDVPLVCAALPDIPIDQTFDAVISPGASLNYLTGAELAETFRAVAALLRPGGSFAFDVLSPGTMSDQGGGNTLAGDLDDLAFILTYHNSPDGTLCDVTWTQFVRTEAETTDLYLKTVEHHRMYRLTPRTIRAAAEACGLVEQGAYDNYTFRPMNAATPVQTWAFQLPRP